MHHTSEQFKVPDMLPHTLKLSLTLHKYHFYSWNSADVFTFRVYPCSMILNNITYLRPIVLRLSMWLRSLVYKAGFGNRIFISKIICSIFWMTRYVWQCFDSLIVKHKLDNLTMQFLNIINQFLVCWILDG